MSLGAVLAAAVLAAATDAPDAGALPNQTLVFYNARLALREGQSAEALTLWLLHNSLADQDRHRGVNEEEFRSVVWAALGNAGLCQDGFPKDDEGAGLWPLALHNWLVAMLAKGPPPEIENPWDAFEVGRQQRAISIHDVLSVEELKSLEFQRNEWCFLPGMVQVQAGRIPFMDYTDRLQVGTVMQTLLKRSLATLVRRKVENVATIEARLFDLDLALVELQKQRARAEGLEAQESARAAGVSREGAKAVRARAEQWPFGSPQARFLKKTLGWSAAEWLSLSKDRRLALFAQAKPYAEDPAALEQLQLAIIDALIARGEGRELEVWLGGVAQAVDPEAALPPPPPQSWPLKSPGPVAPRAASLTPADLQGQRRALTEGARGERLLALEPATGFHERAVIALHRGVAFLEGGARAEALRSFAYALSRAEESRDSARCASLARRWLSYVLAHYEANDEVVATLKALVPRQEYTQVLEGLVWRAALKADAASFERLVATAQHGGAFDTRVTQLRPLAKGNPGALATLLRKQAEDEPYFTLRFVRQLLEELESEAVDVRRANVPLLKLVVQVLDGIGGAAGTNKSQARTAEALIGRAQSVMEGLGAFDDSPTGRARGLAPGREAFAGNVRLAPVDPLPWPFSVPEVDAPSAFIPLVLKPVEWRDAQGALVFGWRLTE